MRVLEPAPGVLGFYAGRDLTAAPTNWLEEALALGLCAYALVAGERALLHDTHGSPALAAWMRAELHGRGVRRFEVVSSHWHVDHIAGNAVFQDMPITARAATRAALIAHAPALRGGDPPVDPLVLPSRILEGDAIWELGGRPVELRGFEIHSNDALVLFLPEDGLLLAGDTLEDPITYVDEPARLAVHLEELDRLAALPIRRILPCHGAPDVIARGGYGPELLDATRRYVERLIRVGAGRLAPDPDLRRFLPEPFAAGAIGYFPPYEAVHRQNLAAVLAAARGA